MAQLGPFELWTLPNGSTVAYRDSDHSYHGKIREVKGKWTAVQASRLPSPSTVSKFVDPNPDRLMDWAARKNLEGVVQLGSIDSIVDADGLNRTLNEKKLTWRHLREAAGDTGTSIHEAFEEGLKGTPVPIRDVKPEEHGHLIALDRFFNDCHDFELLQAEQVVCSQEHGFAGRFDARIRVPLKDHSGLSGGVGPGGPGLNRGFDSPTDPPAESETWLLDLKTSKFIGRSYHAQLHAYDLAAEECGVGASDRLLILQTRVEGTYTLWPCRSSRQTFLHALALYNAGRLCDAQTRADWKALAA